MQNPWTILLIILLIDVPVAIDATILHVAAPSLSLALGVSGQQLLWIIDIYPLMMAGLVLPMGALGDRIGYKRLLMTGGALFGLASLAAGLAPNAASLIAARALLAVGAAMIVPATLAGIRLSFARQQDRNLALGIWTAVGSGGAAFGPLLGGALLAHFYWGAVFLVNIPLVLIALALVARHVPAQPQDRQRQLNLGHALMLTSAILLLVLGLKNGIKGGQAGFALATLILGALLLWCFIVTQRRSASPLLDLSLFGNRVIMTGAIMAITAMVTLVGFELLTAQEMQFVHGLTPLAAGIFMLPLMLASGLSGPLAGILVSRIGLRRVATIGMALSALSFAGLAVTDFATEPYQAWALMALLGFSGASALLAGTSAIMAAAPEDKAASAGAIETMAYELGAGLGVALFGLILGHSYQASIALPAGLTPDEVRLASSSIGEAATLVQTHPHLPVEPIMQAAQSAFISAHSIVLACAAGLLVILTFGVNFGLKRLPAQH